MGLVKALQSAMQPQHAPSQSNTAIAVTSLKTSAGAIQAIGKGSIKNAGAMAAVVPLIGSSKNGKGIDQSKATSVAQRMGAISHDAAMLAAIEPVITKAAGDYIRAETSRVKIAKTIAAANQKVAVLNSKTQAEAFMGHVQAHAETNYYQSAYGGL